jgi:hypothetical protein
MPHCHSFALVVLLLSAAPVVAAPTVLESRRHHLRAGIVREWSDFPAEPDGPRLTMKFRAKPNAGEQTLRLRQQDVKQVWKVLLNGKELGRLTADENDTELVLPIPAGRLVDGENTLVIEPTNRAPDDIRVGEITLDDRPVKEVLSEATVEIVVREEVRPGERVPVPCRVTILNARGALAATGTTSTDRLAVRPGVIYTVDGTARFGVPAGDYTVHAGRGFEYGIDTVRVSLKAGETVRKELTIRCEVPTPGFVASDTHVHTLTHSGHGDATDIERAVTIAGEGIELPIATEHNLQVDYHAAAVKTGLREYYTPVVGNEVTTNVGHFNVFPLPAGGPVPDFKVKDWKGVAAALGKPASPRIVILNHPRDLHAKFRPFGPERHVALTGEDLDGWELPASAMEVVNSGAQQTDVMRPVRDWFGMLNRGAFLTPVGSSDSHDVNRYIVGQGRTYIRCKDDKPGEIGVEEAVKNFLDSRVLVSCGLLTEITVDEKHGPGDLVPVNGEVSVTVRVLGPAWTTADRVELFVNGVRVHEAAIEDKGKAGEKWSGKWTLPRPVHDLHLVAVATGPGVEGLFWPVAKPYQPTSPVVRKRVIGVTGAVWLDGDGDGRRTSARDYARKVVNAAGTEWRKAIASLAGYDEAVAAQVAGLLRAAGVSPSDKNVRAAAKAAGEPVMRGFDAYAEAWRENQITRQAVKP